MEIPKELEARLVNWGRWGREPRGQGRSWLAKYACDATPSEPGAAPINVKDAEEVDRVWRMMPFTRYDERRSKLLIAALYTSGRSTESDLRNLRRYHKIRIAPHEVEGLKAKAIRYIGRHLGYVIQ